MHPIGLSDVLMVEDDPIDAELMARAMTHEGLADRVMFLDSGAEALDFLRARGDWVDRSGALRPKVVFLDLKLPGMGGLEILSAIRADAALRRLPVVILSSSREGNDVWGAYDLGANSFLVKPTAFDALRRMLGQAIRYWLSLNETEASNGSRVSRGPS